MIWQAWVTVVLIGSGAAYIAFVRKKAAVATGLLTFACFAVAAFGALGLEVPQSASDAYVSTETAVAILCGMVALGGAIVFAAAVTGQYGVPDEFGAPGAGVVREETRR